MKTTKGGKALAPVVDIFPQIAVGYHDEARVAEEMRLLKSFGFDRVYFVLCNPGYPMFSSPVLCMQPPDVPGLENYAFPSLVALGDANFAYLHQCHRHGMEAYAIIKPYECGGGTTVPHGAERILNAPCEETIGGERIGFDNLLGSHPEWRVKRKPMADYERLVSQNVEKITAAFCLDPIEAVNENGSAEAGTVPIQYHLFTSEDNGEYIRYDGPLEIEEKLEAQEIRDPNGTALYDTPKQCRSVTLSGFSFPPETRYFAIALESGNTFYTIPQSMLAIHGPEGEIPSTVSPYMRQSGNEFQTQQSSRERIWGMEQIPYIPNNFTEAVDQLASWGFEYEWYGTGFKGVGWKDAHAYGIARGKLQWMKGTPCEAYPEVREYWLDWVEKCIEMGFDGVDIRLQNHSGMVSDYFNYGFNEPIVEAYREKYGVDILEEEPDPLQLMSVRGEFFMEFLQEAADLLHEAGRKLQVHLRHCNEAPKLSFDINELGFWAMPKIWLEDWRRVIDLADEITLKDYHFNNYNSTLAPQIKAYANSQNKRVWIHCYIAQGRDLNADFLNSVEQDNSVGGVLLYEVANSAKNEVNLGLIEQYGPVGLNEPVAQELRNLLEMTEYNH